MGWEVSWWVMIAAVLNAAGWIAAMCGWHRAFYWRYQADAVLKIEMRVCSRLAATANALIEEKQKTAALARQLARLGTPEWED